MQRRVGRVIFAAERWVRTVDLRRGFKNFVGEKKQSNVESMV